MGEGERQEVLLWEILPHHVKQVPGNKCLSLTSASLGSCPALTPYPVHRSGLCLLPVSDSEKLPAPVWIMAFVSSGDSSSSPSESAILLSGGGVYVPLLEPGLACDLLRPREGGRRDIVSPPSPGLRKHCASALACSEPAVGKKPTLLERPRGKGPRPPDLASAPSSSSPSAE